MRSLPPAASARAPLPCLHLKASDTAWVPWFVVRSDDKRRARLNVIRHLLDHIPYKKKPEKKVRLPERQPRGDYGEPDYPFKFVPEHDWTANG
jgi:polyphosphate kinase